MSAITDVLPAATVRPRSPRRAALRRFARNRLALAGAIVLTAVVILALLAPVVTQQAPTDVDLDSFRNAPSTLHWFGTDASGRDVFARVIYASRVSLLVGVAATLVSVTLGTLLGAIAGVARGFLDRVIMRAADIVLSFPTIVVIIVLAGVLGPSVGMLIVAIGVTHWPQTCRVVQGVTLSLREKEYIHAARAGGAGS